MTIDQQYRVEWNHPKRGWEQITIQNSELEWSEEKEENEVFFRRKLKTQLVLKDTEYAELIKIERSRSKCNFIDIRFEKKCDATYYEFWNGRLHLIDGNYDLENCVIRITPRPIDDYTCVFDSWEKEKNIIDEVGVLEAPHKFGRYKLYTNALWSYYIPSAEIDVNSYHQTQDSAKVQRWFDNGQAGEVGHFLDDIDYSNTTVISTFALSNNIYRDSQGQIRNADISPDQNPKDFEGTWIMTNVYAYEVYEAECDGGVAPDPPEGDEWVQMGSPSCPDTHYWYRPLQSVRCDDASKENFRYISNEGNITTSSNTVPVYQYNFVVKANGDLFQTIRILGAHWRYNNSCSIASHVSSGQYLGEGIYFPLELDNGMDFNAVLQYFTGLCGFSVVSDFYGINPDNKSPNNQYYTYAEKNLQSLSLFQLTDISNPFAEENATIARVKFKDLLSDLKTLHNVYWEIRDGVFRVEHLSYFKNQYKVDLTSSVSEYIEGLKSYEYVDIDFPKREEWQFKLKSDKDTTQEFDGIPIEYESACISEENSTKNFNTNLIVTNFNFFSENEDYQDQDGLFLLATEEEEDFGTVRYAKYTVNALSGLNLINSSQAIPNLLENLHTTGRPQESGIMNNEEVKFTSYVRQRLGGELKFPICCSEMINYLDPADLFKSYLGWGEVEEFLYTDPQGVVRLTLRHD